MVAWVLLSGLASLVAGLILIDRRSTRHGPIEPGHCPLCNYEITGLPNGAACPECGATAVDMERLRTLRITRRDVLVGPMILFGTTYTISMAIGLWPVVSQPSAVPVLAAALGAFPFGILSLLLLTVSRRIMPVAANVIAAFSAVSVAPLLTYAFYQTSLTLNKDALNGIVFFLASMAAVPISGFGFLIGAVVVQHPWFKRIPSARCPPSAGHAMRADSSG